LANTAAVVLALRASRRWLAPRPRTLRVKSPQHGKRFEALAANPVRT